MAWTAPADWSSSEVPTSAKMNAQIRDNLDAAFPNAVSLASWSPSLTSSGGAFGDAPTVSDAGQYRIGAIVEVWARFVMSGSSNGSGTWSCDLPVAASGITASTSSGQVIGEAYLYDDDISTNRQVAGVFLATTTSVRFVVADGGWAADTNPFTWTTNDVLSFRARYPVA